MNNAVLDRIKKFAIQELKNEYGYCGSAEGEDFALLNSEDRNGNDIKINIKLIPEVE